MVQRLDAPWEASRKTKAMDLSTSYGHFDGVYPQFMAIRMGFIHSLWSFERNLTNEHPGFACWFGLRLWDMYIPGSWQFYSGK